MRKKGIRQMNQKGVGKWGKEQQKCLSIIDNQFLKADLVVRMYVISVVCTNARNRSVVTYPDPGESVRGNNDKTHFA